MGDRNRDAIFPDRGRPDTRAGILAAAVLLCLAAPQTLLAAASLGSGCDSIARELKSVEIPVGVLTVDIVDHMVEDHGALDPVVGHEHDPTAPLLFLTPRVAHILQDVFGDADTAAEPAATPMERVRRIMLAANAAAEAQAPEAAAASADGESDARAEMNSGGDPSVSSGPLTETFYDVDTLPRFQRRMYRNDI